MINDAKLIFCAVVVVDDQEVAAQGSWLQLRSRVDSYSQGMCSYVNEPRLVDIFLFFVVPLRSHHNA